MVSARLKQLGFFNAAGRPIDPETNWFVTRTPSVIICWTKSWHLLPNLYATISDINHDEAYLPSELGLPVILSGFCVIADHTSFNSALVMISLPRIYAVKWPLHASVVGYKWPSLYVHTWLHRSDMWRRRVPPTTGCSLPLLMHVDLAHFCRVHMRFLNDKQAACGEKELCFLAAGVR